MDLSHMQKQVKLLTSTFLLEDSPPYDRSNYSPQPPGQYSTAKTRSRGYYSAPNLVIWYKLKVFLLLKKGEKPSLSWSNVCYNNRLQGKEPKIRATNLVSCETPSTCKFQPQTYQTKRNPYFTKSDCNRYKKIGLIQRSEVQRPS